VLSPPPAHIFGLGSMIGAGNFGNVYALKTVDRETTPTPEAIKQLSLEEDTTHEDAIARAYAALKKKMGGALPHLAIMDEAFVGTVTNTGGMFGGKAKQFKFQVGPNCQGTHGKDLRAYTKSKWNNRDPPLKDGPEWGRWVDDVKKVAHDTLLGLGRLHECSGLNMCGDHEGRVPVKGGPFAHNDVKADNIFLRINANAEIENAALGDLGVAQAEPRTAWRTAKEGTVMSQRCPKGFADAGLGSPLYMAPEHRHGHACRPFGSNDMWSLGFTLLEMMVAPAVCQHMADCVYQPGHEVYSDMKWGAHVKVELPSRVRDTLTFAGGELLAWAAKDPSRTADIDAFVELVQGLLETVTTKRLTAKQALLNPFVRGGAAAGSAAAAVSPHLRANADVV
jgi:serine/threonine protein kinase